MLQVIVDARAVSAAFARLRSCTDDLRPALTDISEYYLKRIDDGFRKEEDPYGVLWEPLKPKTLERKRSSRPPQILKILQATGTFRGSWSYTPGKDFVEIGSNRVSKKGKPYPEYHQNPKPNSKLPKRQTLPDISRGLPPADSQEIVDIISDYIDSAWSR